MIWVGITGPMGGGKSSVAKLVRARGFMVINADEIVHQLMEPGGAACDEIFRTFGEAVRSQDGRVDRQALGRLVFSDSAKLDQLERVLHPKVRARVYQIKTDLESAGAAAGFYDVPLLFEKKMEDQFDAIWVVTASAPTRMQRLKARTGLSEKEIELRWKSQFPPEFKEQRATQLIRNEGSLSELEKSVDQTLHKMGLLPAATNS